MPSILERRCSQRCFAIHAVFRSGIDGVLTSGVHVDAIIFTGGTDTAKRITTSRPDIYFAGETGGKNATIVTAAADRDQAIKISSIPRLVTQDRNVLLRHFLY